MEKVIEKKRKKQVNNIRRYKYTGYAFIAPASLVMIGLIIYPMLYGAYISFYNTNLVNRWKFVGLRYYIQAVTKSDFYNSLMLTFWFMILVVAGHFLLGFILASALNK